MDRFDVMVLAGLVLIGIAVWLAFGLLSMMFYIGTVLIVTGLSGALVRGRNGRTE